MKEKICVIAAMVAAGYFTCWLIEKMRENRYLGKVIYGEKFLKAFKCGELSSRIGWIIDDKLVDHENSPKVVLEGISEDSVSYIRLDHKEGNKYLATIYSNGEYISGYMMLEQE